jgi:hypothetical protein
VTLRRVGSHWRPIIGICAIALFFIDPLAKWYAARSVEVTVVNDSEQAVSNLIVSLPPESIQISNLKPFEVVTRYLPRVVATKDWQPDQTGMLANGTHIQGNGSNSGEGVFIPRFFYVICKDGTVSSCGKLGE